MTLAFAPFDKELKVTKINADEKTVRRLASLGLCVGGVVTSMYDNGGNVILKVLDSRVALNKALAMKILVA